MNKLPVELCNLRVKPCVFRDIYLFAIQWKTFQKSLNCLIFQQNHIPLCYIVIGLKCWNKIILFTIVKNLDQQYNRSLLES